MILTTDDLFELTDYKRPSDQRRWLNANGINFLIGRSGRPKVSWESVKKLLNKDGVATKSPAFDAIND